MMPRILQRLLFRSRSLALIEPYLRVEDKIFRCAGVLAVVHGSSVQLGQSGVQHLAQSFVHGCVIRQRAWDLELLDYDLQDKTI